MERWRQKEKEKEVARLPERGKEREEKRAAIPLITINIMKAIILISMNSYEKSRTNTHIKYHNLT